MAQVQRNHLLVHEITDGLQIVRRLDQLDYRKTMADYKAAEQSRKEEAARRAKLLAEAAQREADARGWRE